MIQGRRVPNIDARTARFEALVLAALLAIYIIQPLKRLGL